jgi:hypothetical protein
MKFLKVGQNYHDSVMNNTANIASDSYFREVCLCMKPTALLSYHVYLFGKDIKTCSLSPVHVNNERYQKLKLIKIYLTLTDITVCIPFLSLSFQKKLNQLAISANFSYFGVYSITNMCLRLLLL